MNTNSFVKDFFFKDDGDGLAVNTFRIVLVTVLIIAVAFSIYQYIEWGNSSISIVVGYLLLGLIFTVPLYVLTRLFAKDERPLPNLAKNDIQTISIILAIAVATVLILANILFKQSLFLESIVLAALVGACVYFVGNKYLSVEPLAGGISRKSHNLIFLIGWVLAFFSSILGIIVGIYLYTRKDNEYSKVHGLILVFLGIIVWIASLYLESFFGYYW